MQNHKTFILHTSIIPTNFNEYLENINNIIIENKLDIKIISYVVHMYENHILRLKGIDYKKFIDILSKHLDNCNYEEIPNQKLNSGIFNIVKSLKQ